MVCIKEVFKKKKVSHSILGLMLLWSFWLQGMKTQWTLGKGGFILRIFVGNLPVASSLEKASNSQVNRPHRRNRIRTISLILLSHTAFLLLLGCPQVNPSLCSLSQPFPFLRYFQSCCLVIVRGSPQVSSPFWSLT